MDFSLSTDPDFEFKRAIQIAKDQLTTIGSREIDTSQIETLRQVLVASYSDSEVYHLEELLTEFLALNREKIHLLYNLYKDDSRCSPWLFCPEALLLFERLQTRPNTLRGVWGRYLPNTAIEALQVFWGNAAF